MADDGTRELPIPPPDGFGPDKCQTILHYEFIRRIGQGAMGEVYLARDTRLGRQVALKFLPPWFSKNERARELLIHEARSASALHHQNIVSIFSLEECGDRDFIVMEYVEGISLKDLTDQGKLEVDNALKIAMDICSGLEAARRAGMTHCDIKPQNILLDISGQGKICDFGLSQIKGSAALLERGSVAGTPAYMSPEQAQGLDADHRSDIFSFGIVLYQMLTGVRPFTGDYEAALIYSIVNEPAPPLQAYSPDLPHGLQAIIDKTLAKNPAQRYQNAGEILSDLEIIANPKPPEKASRGPLFRAFWAVPLAIILIAAFWIFLFRPLQHARRETDRKMIAVLPFENLGAADDKYFSDGITDAIITNLSQIRGLGVISFTSVRHYENSGKTTPEIAHELGVDYVLEGTVLLDKSSEPATVRINPQLIRAADDTHIWATTYERTLAKVFALQSEIANDVTGELGVRLLEPEKRSLLSIPTSSVDAYDYFLRGGMYYQNRSWRKQDLEIAIVMYKKAIELDPSFALAYAMLSRAHSVLYKDYHDRSPERLKLARDAVNAALRLNPELPDAHLALGHYYYSILAFDSAMAQFELVRKSQPQNSDLLGSIAGLLRRKGDFEGALSDFLMAFKLDPFSQTKAFDVAFTYSMMRKYPEAESYLDQASSLAPDWPLPYIYKAWLHIFWKGDKSMAQQILAGASKMTDLSQTEYFDYFWWLSRIVYPDFKQTLQEITMGPDSASYYLARGRIYYLSHDSGSAAACFDSAKTILEMKVEAQPNDPRFHAQLGYVLGGQGNSERAIAEGNKAIELLPLTVDAYDGQFMIANLAEIYVMLGKYDQAIELLKDLLSHPGFTSVPYLKADPIWEPLWERAEFKELDKLSAGTPG